MEEEKYILTSTQLRRLIRAEEILYALECGGVDNWEWYGESIGDYLKNINCGDIDDAVDKELQTYQILI